MKTNRNLFILFVTSLLTLAGCGGNAPLNKYQKVSKAFEAVARTLDLSSNRRSLMPKQAINIHGDMSNFDTYFTNAQTDERIEDQLDLDSPPFMQFQYLKVIYESIGGNYSFDTKYSHTITGDVYIDFETGYKDETRSNENKYSFTFDLSIYVNINDNDLITSEVGMDITLTHDRDTYKYYKYALLILDYDFEQNDDNYEMALYDYGQDKDLAYLHCDYGYEYDYCLISHNKLIEWRKFRYEADRKMVKDAAHPTLDSYINEGAEITYDNQRWYKNNVLKRVDSNTSASLSIAKELYRSFGLNNTDLNPEGFFAKASTDSNVIQTIYDGASREYGDELMYHIIGEEDDEKEGNGWPNHDIEQITGINSITFSNRDAVTFESYRDDRDGESASVVITVKGANSDEYRVFEDALRETYGFMRTEDQMGFHIYTLTLIDNTILSVFVSSSTNTIIFMHYFGGSDSPYEAIELENMITYDLPYNSYSQSYFSSEKEVFEALSKLFNDQNIDKVFTGKINVEKSQKVNLALSDKDLEYVTDAKTVKDARDIVMSQYEDYYKNQWTTTDYKGVFLHNDDKDMVAFEVGKEDNSFSVYFFRCVDDTMKKYLTGSIAQYLSIEIYMHSHSGDVYLYDTIYVQENESVIPYLDSNVIYYLDNNLTTILSGDNCYAYDGMVLHRKDYEDPVYETISVAGGIDYTYGYSWYNDNLLIEEEAIYNRVMNMVGDPNIRAYLEGKVSTSKKANNAYYEIFIGPEVAEAMGMTDDFAQATKSIYTKYTKEYSSWNKGTKGEYFYTGENEEDVVFFDKERLADGFIIFIHLHLTSPVMANYESN